MTSAADACGGADVFGDGTIDDTNRVRVVKSTTALDEAASVEFQLIQRQIEILENSEARTVQRPLHRQRRRKNEIGGLHPGALYPRSSRTDSERCHRYRHDDRQVASDDSRSSKDELNTAHDESHFFRCSQTSEDFDDEDSESTVRKQPVITAADNVRAATAAEGAAASAAAHVRKKKAAKSRAREEHQQDGSFGSAMRSGEDDGVNCEWLPSKTWKYFRRSSIDDNHLDDDDDDDNDERKISRVVAECNSKRRRRRRWGFIVGDVSSTASTVVVTSATSSSEYDDAVEQRFGAGVGSGSMSSSLHCAVDSESDAKTMSTLSLQSASRWSAEHGGGDRSLTKAGGSLVRSGGFDNLHEACILHPAEPDQWSVQRAAMTSDADTEFGRTCAEAEWSPPLANSGNFAAGDNDANDVELSSFDLIKDLNRAVAVTDGKWIVGEPDESAVDTTMEYGCPSGDESWSERRRSWPV
jgi:hypothetical protein